MKEQVNDLSGVQVGDKLWEISLGEVTVMNLFKDRIKVTKHGNLFKLDGVSECYEYPTLFWDKPVFEYPKKPKTVTIREDKFNKAFDELLECEHVDIPLCFQKQFKKDLGF